MISFYFKSEFIEFSATRYTLCGFNICRYTGLFVSGRTKRFHKKSVKKKEKSFKINQNSNFRSLKDRLKSVSSLFVISNTNGNLIEYVLEVNVDVTKTGNKRTNDSPILLKVTPKAQWPLQRSISTSDAKYQLNVDNPLLLMYKNINSLPIAGSNSSNNSSPNTSGIMTTNDEDSMNNEWIKLVEISTHLGPHRRLFMGPQFVFKTINTNITTTALNANSSAIVSTETPLIDLSGDLELNSLE